MLNDEHAIGSTIGEVPVLGRFDDWATLDGDMEFIAAFPLPTAARRILARLHGLAIPAGRFASVVHPTAVTSPSTEIGAGCFIAAGAVVEHHARLGPHTIVRSCAYVSHDVVAGEHCFFGPSSTALGRSSFGDGAHVGANSVVREGTRVGAFAVIGIGSAVIREVPDGATVAGSPARALS
jgi:acetyltransferase EpsM